MNEVYSVELEIYKITIKMVMRKLCFVCGKDKELIHERKEIEEAFHSHLVHPLFPIPPSTPIPEDTRICKLCMHFVNNRLRNCNDSSSSDSEEEDQDNEKAKKKVVAEIMRKMRLSKEKFDRRVDPDINPELVELRDKAMYPCDFGVNSSSFGFTEEEVGGEFRKLPDEMLDKIFSFLTPREVKNVRKVSSFMRNKTFPSLHLTCPIRISAWTGDELFAWPHLMNHRNFSVQATSGDHLGKMLDKRIKEIFDGISMKRLKLDSEINGQNRVWVRDYVFPAMMNLEALEISLKVREKQVQMPTWGSSLGPRLKSITLRGPTLPPRMNEFIETTNKTTALHLKNPAAAWANKLMSLLKNENEKGGAQAWPNLESFSWTYDWHHVGLPRKAQWSIDLLNSLGSRPIRRIEIIMNYSTLGTFIEFLRRSGDTLEWVDLTILLHGSDAWGRPFKQFELPENLSKLRGLKLTVKDAQLVSRSSRFPFQRCCLCSVRGSKVKRGKTFRWYHSRDFFNFGALLTDPQRFGELFPNLRHLALLVPYSADDGPLKCHSCVDRKEAFCRSFFPQNSSNTNLITLELSHPTDEEHLVLCTIWREKLGRMFPNANIADAK